MTTRRLAAILAADVAGFSAMMERDEEGTAARIRALRGLVIEPLLAKHHGRLIKTTGDGFLAEFASPVEAVRSAIAIQEQLAAADGGNGLRLRIGINLGDIIIEDDGDVFGDGVNVAARLEQLAEPGGVCISGEVERQVAGKIDRLFEDRGEQQVKNLARTVGVFALGPTMKGSSKPLAFSDKPSIAVLPFTNMSGDPEQEHFADGIVEDVITELSRFEWLAVIARNSSFTYKGHPVNVENVGRELRVRYVLEGSVRRVGDRVRVTAQLIEASGARHIWAEKFDRPFEDVFAIQDEVTTTIVGTLAPEISAAERDRVRIRPPQHLGAWELYQKGMWHLLRRNASDLASAKELFRAAAHLDTGFSAPRSAAAIACFFEITHGVTRDHTSTVQELISNASDAMALEPRDGAAHSALGLGLMERQEFASAISEHDFALKLNPNAAFSHYAAGYTLMRAGRNEEALYHFDTALRLSPRDPGLWSYLTLKASTLYQLRRYEEAATVAQEATRHPVADLVWAYVHLAASLGQLGRSVEAEAAVAELRRRRPGLTVTGFREWPHSRSRSTAALGHTAEGLRKAGLPE